MNNVQECSKKCSDVPECDHFTWYKVNNVCYLKKGEWVDNKPGPLADAQCGYIPGRSWTADANGVTWKNNCDFPGFDVDTTKDPPKTKKEDCGTSCLSNPECDRFTWTTSGNCQHKKWSATVATVKDGARCGFIPARSWNVDDYSLWTSNFTFNYVTYGCELIRQHN